MEICIIKKLFMTVDVDVDESTTREELSDMLKDVVDNADINDYDEYDWTGNERYEAYDTDSGCDIELYF